MTTPRPEAIAAAQWWTDHLKVVDFDAIEDTIQVLPTSHAPEPGKIEHRYYFPEEIASLRDALAEEIEARLAGRGPVLFDGLDRRTIVSGYGPPTEMERAARRCGITLGRADVPFKTIMDIRPAGLRVFDGETGVGRIVWLNGAVDDLPNGA